MIQSSDFLSCVHSEFISGSVGPWQSLLEICDARTAGVASVSSAVVTIPVPNPFSRASSKIVLRSRSVDGVVDILPLLVLFPVAHAVAEQAAEALRAAELAKAGHLIRLWRPPLKPGEWRSIGLFRAADEAELRQILDSLPLHIWMKVTITPLTPHPNDPQSRSSRDIDHQVLSTLLIGTHNTDGDASNQN